MLADLRDFIKVFTIGMWPNMGLCKFLSNLCLTAEKSNQYWAAMNPEEPTEELLPNDDAQTQEVNENEESRALKEALERESELRDHLIRLAADFDNFRKQSRREQEDLRRYGIDRLVRDLLPVLDNLERALAHSNEGDQNAVIQGVRMVAKQMQDTLASHGVVSFASVGTAFDPLRHDAIGQVASDQHPEGHVAVEIDKGYMLHDRLLRPARVMVTSNTL
jgi:molecular chaperone GrpE